MKTADLIVAAGSASADLLYATGFSTSDAYIYIGMPEKRLMIVSDLEFDRARKQGKKGMDVLTDQDLTGSEKRIPQEKLIAMAAEKYDIGNFRVPADFPLGLAEKLRAEGLLLRVAEGPLFFPEREFKTREEIRLITEALRLAEKAVLHAREVLGACSIANDGTLMLDHAVFTQEMLRREIDLVLAAGGAMPTGTIAAAGRHAACPHDCGSGPVKAGEPIVMDVFPRMLSSGYWGDLTRTVVKGTPSITVQNAFDAVLRARDRAESMLSPGVVPSAVHQAAAELMTQAGFPTGRRTDGSWYGFFHGLGHGVGLEIHELPHLNLRGTLPLKGGEVITVEPGLYDDAWGGIRMEDMIYITPSGAERLTEITDDFVIE